MNRHLRSLCLACALVFALPAHAAIKVLATTADWGSLAAELGGDKVNVYTATTALQDVHRVDAKPSLVARMRSELSPKRAVALLGLLGVVFFAGYLVGTARGRAARPAH